MCRGRYQLRAKLSRTGIRFGSVIRRGMLADSRVVDAPPHKISIDQTVAMAPDF